MYGNQLKEGNEQQVDTYEASLILKIPKSRLGKANKMKPRIIVEINIAIVLVLLFVFTGNLRFSKVN